jgi:hypothetical protein
LAHLELAGKVVGAGGGPVTAQSAAADSGSCRRNGDGGGDSGRSSPMPSVRRWREVRRSCWVPRRSSGRRKTARGGDGHGGELGLCERFHGRERGASQGERKGRGGERGVQVLLQGVHLVGSAASRRWRRGLLEPPRSCSVSQRRGQVQNANSPLALVIF